MVKVESSNIEGFDYENDTLTIHFKSGSSYEYYGVPESVVKEFFTASSKGKFFNSEIKSVYPYKRV